MNLLEINGLSAEAGGKEILKNVSLKLEQGQVYGLMGPNGSGKSTLANVVMGNPSFNVVGGQIFFEGADVSGLAADERARKGIFLSFQYPKDVAGVTISNFLRTAYNSVNVDSKMSFLEFQKFLETEAGKLEFGAEFLNRYVNEGFSGGERKKGEVLQMRVLNPKLAILDEMDSGLDIDSLRVVARAVRDFAGAGNCVLVITHYSKVLDYLKPDEIFVMKGGRIVKSGGSEVKDEVEERGYGGINETE